MAALYLMAALAETKWPAAAYPRAFFEAAMVGGLADWFAVTALFRRPLGLPIPHTAIIPRNKTRIGQALGRFIVDNFLSSAVLSAKLKELELARWGGEWLTHPRNMRRAAEQVVAFAPELLRALPPGALEELAGASAAAAARATPAAPLAAVILSAAWNEGRLQPLIDRGSEVLKVYLTEHRDVVLEAVRAQSFKWLPTFVDEAIAGRITEGLVRLLSEVQEPAHPWRVELGAAVERLARRLADDESLLAAGERLKTRLLSDRRLHDTAHRLWGGVEERLKAEWTGGGEDVVDKAERLIRDLGSWLKADPKIQGALNSGARALVRQALEPRREEIGRFVADVVESWEAESVVERLELQVGPDLQVIRISGALVGGAAGLAIYAVSRLLKLP
jgi:uncharacterized membrane-anchored protein YjiN (DUF445 family)